MINAFQIQVNFPIYDVIRSIYMYYFRVYLYMLQLNEEYLCLLTTYMKFKL